MSQNISPVLTAIFSALRAGVKNVDVMMGDYTMDSYIPKVDGNGLFSPYILCKVHTSYETSDNGIVGKDKDPLQGSFSFYIVTPDGWATQKLTDLVRTTLRGKRFAGSDALTVSGGYSFVDPDLGFHRYVQNIGFTFKYNLAG